MRSRAYRPEVTGCLEDRLLLTGDPFVLPLRQLHRTTLHMQFSFGSFARLRVLSDLRDELQGEAKSIPFGRADGLGASIDLILDDLQRDLSARVPHAIHSAQNALFGVIRADLSARIRSGDLILR